MQLGAGAAEAGRQPRAEGAHAGVPQVVLDTNVLLDLWLFDDPRVRGLREAIAARRVLPLRSAECDAEFADVLRRPQFGLDPPRCERILAHWAGCSVPVDTVQPAPLACADPDDQKFLDAAFSAGAGWLLTRDKALLALARGAAAHGVRICCPEAAMTYDRRQPDPTKMQIDSRLPGVGTTVFTVMSALAAKHGAVNLGQGFPDFDCDPQLQRLLAEAVAAGHNQYAPMTGVPALREAVAAKVQRLYGRSYDAEREVTVTAGATQAIMAAVLATVRPGDEVIVLEPTYDSYVPSILLAGGTPVYVPLDAARGYAPDWERVRAAITPRTRLLMLNFPHNPSGRCLGAADLAALEGIVRDSGVLLLSDEVYEHIVFDGQPHQSLSRSAELAQRTFVVSSFGKTFHITGWKVGTCCAPAALTAELRKVHQFMVFAVNTPAQHALARFMAEPARYESLPAFYQRKRDLFVDGLARTRLRPLPCPGTYFVLADYSAVSDEPEASFAERLTREHGVAAIPVAGLYAQPFDNRIVRFCFAKKEETLQRALERLTGV